MAKSKVKLQLILCCKLAAKLRLTCLAAEEQQEYHFTRHKRGTRYPTSKVALGIEPIKLKILDKLSVRNLG